MRTTVTACAVASLVAAACGSVPPVYCNCSGHGTCDPSSGACRCDSGYYSGEVCQLTPHTLAGSGTFCCGQGCTSSCISPGSTFTHKLTKMEFKFPPKDPTSETKVAFNYTINGATTHDELPYEYSDLTLEPMSPMVIKNILHCKNIGTISNHPEDLR